MAEHFAGPWLAVAFPRRRWVFFHPDELESAPAEAEIGPVRELVREEMCSAYPLDPPLAVEIGVGDDWSEAKS